MLPQPAPPAGVGVTTSDAMAGLLDAQERTAALIRTHGLWAGFIQYNPRPAPRSGKEPWPSVVLMLHPRPAEALRWLDVLQVEQVAVSCGASDTAFYGRVAHDGVWWGVGGSLPYTTGCPRLPGATVQWRRSSTTGRALDDGTMTVTDLTAAMKNLGVLDHNRVER